MKIIQNSRRNG